LTTSPVIKKPEITKKTSTPTKPPEKPGTPKWYNTTAATAQARKPLMSGLKLGLLAMRLVIEVQAKKVRQVTESFSSIIEASVEKPSADS